MTMLTIINAACIVVAALSCGISLRKRRWDVALWAAIAAFATMRLQWGS